MKVWLDRYCRLLEALLVVLLALMVVLVFGNVVLRYAFNSGILLSEEVSRWLFVWLIFLGAVIALRQRSHLGTDVLVSRVGPLGRKMLAVVSHAVMLWVSWLLLVGLWEQARLNLNVAAPVTGVSMAVFYSSGVVFAVSALLMLGYEMIRILRGQVSDDELVMVRESEEQARAESPVAQAGSLDRSKTGRP